MSSNYIMIWPGIGWYQGKIDINFLLGYLNNEKYIKLIDDQLNNAYDSYCR